jgi:hypothetical protein
MLRRPPLTSSDRRCGRRSCGWRCR